MILKIYDFIPDFLVNLYLSLKFPQTRFEKHVDLNLTKLKSYKFGKNTKIGRYSIVGENFELADNSFVSFFCVIHSSRNSPVKIGKYCRIAPNCHFMTTKKFEYAAIGEIKKLPITIGNNVLIGENSIIMGGVTIGDNVVVGSGSVVTKDVANNVIVAGNPAKIIKEIPKSKEFEDLIER